MNESPEKLGIIAGGGELPMRLATACRDAGRAFHILAIEGYASEKASSFPHSWVALGSVGEAMKILKREACREVVFAGIVKRPDFTKLKLDWRGARLLPRMIAAAKSGDDPLLKVLLAEFEREGFRVVGAEQVFGGLLAKAEILTRVQPTERDLGDIARAVEIVRALGRFDIGQGAVVCDGLVLAVEAAEGTDAMLERCAALPREIRGGADARRGVLVKVPKPAQGKTRRPADDRGCDGRARRRRRTGRDRGCRRRGAHNRRSGNGRRGEPARAFPRRDCDGHGGMKAIRCMLVVGEPSGDALGAQLIKALRQLAPTFEFEGVGGPLMAREGFVSLFSIADTSVMGLKEVVPKIPLILRRVREVSDYAAEHKPDLVVLIDSPDFTHRIARRLKRIAPDIPIVKYVAPQVWASRPWRARSLPEFVDYLLALLPFEPEFFERYGVDTRFVGHPALERSSPPNAGEIAQFRVRHGLKPETPLLVLLPGSRSNEIRFILPVFIDTIRALKEKLPELRVVLPTLPHVRERVAEAVAALPFKVDLIEDEREKFLSFRAATAALAASGTVSTELALSQTPMVIGYRLGWLTYMIARRFVVVKYGTLVNLIADAEVVPEFVQEKCTPENLLGALLPLMTSADARAAQIAAVAPALQKLGVGGEAPSLRAARAVLQIAAVKS